MVVAGSAESSPTLVREEAASKAPASGCSSLLDGVAGVGFAHLEGRGGGLGGGRAPETIITPLNTSSATKTATRLLTPKPTNNPLSVGEPCVLDCLFSSR